MTEKKAGLPAFQDPKLKHKKVVISLDMTYETLDKWLDDIRMFALKEMERHTVSARDSKGHQRGLWQGITRSHYWVIDNGTQLHFDLVLQPVSDSTNKRDEVTIRLDMDPTFKRVVSSSATIGKFYYLAQMCKTLEEFVQGPICAAAKYFESSSDASQKN